MREVIRRPVSCLKRAVFWNHKERMTPAARRQAPAEVPGLTARRIAAEILDNVLRRRRALDAELDGAEQHPGLSALPDRDRALVRKLVATVLRRIGTLRHVLGKFLERGFPDDAPRVETVLLIGAAQILFLDVPDHAAVDLSVRLVQADRRAAKYPGLINAVLRRVAREGQDVIAGLDPVPLDTPEWVFARWQRNYGDETARAIARVHGAEPPLDLTVKSDAESWAQRLRGHVLPTGSVRTITQGHVALLPGYHEGAWWVQDAAAALPARLFGDVSGKSVADLCAAPGGKTAQLSAAGARVTAVDRSANRLARVRENLARLGLAAELVAADATEWQGGPFDAVLVDAPCSSTGTIRRHPDVAWLKSEIDIAQLIDLQRRLLDRAVALTRPGGAIVYCVCSLEPEEGEQQVAALLARETSLRRAPLDGTEVPGTTEFLTAEGDLRTLPSAWPDSDPRLSGLDGFFAARLERI
jgi:16S rRNA (cytosine967-C5)-methyltransferase